jgi:hypothetical protein
MTPPTTYPFNNERGFTMNEKQAAVLSAVQTWKELQELSSTFETSLIEAQNDILFVRADESITVSILGYSLTLKKRAVTIDRQLTYMELSFIYVNSRVASSQ